MLAKADEEEQTSGQAVHIASSFFKIVFAVLQETDNSNKLECG
jgi:hypothetical protein